MSKKTKTEEMADKLMKLSSETSKKYWKLYKEVNLEKKWIGRKGVDDAIKQAMKKFNLKFEVYEFLNRELELDFNLDKHIAENKNKKSSF